MSNVSTHTLGRQTRSFYINKILPILFQYFLRISIFIITPQESNHRFAIIGTNYNFEKNEQIITSTVLIYSTIYDQIKRTTHRLVRKRYFLYSNRFFEINFQNVILDPETWVDSRRNVKERKIREKYKQQER